MSARVVDRGRGPELEGTRVTVYRVMDFLAYGEAPERIARELDLTMDEVGAALNYIEEHRAELDPIYHAILSRAHRANRSCNEADKPRSAADLKQRVRLRRTRGTRHGDPDR